MRILFMLPAAEGVYPVDAAERRVALIASYATSDIEIDVAYLPEASGYEPWGGQDRHDHREPERIGRTHELAYRRAAQAEADGYDAFCPFGAADVGVALARERGVGIPCIGPGESNLLLCGLLGRRYATCAYVASSSRPDQDAQQAAALGVGHLYVGSTAIGIPNSEFPARHAEVLERYRICVVDAQQMGAEIMGNIGQSICPTEFTAKALLEATGMHAMDGIANQIAIVEWCHRTGLPASLINTARVAEIAAIDRPERPSAPSQSIS